MKEQELIQVNHEIERINDRVQNVERIASTVEALAEHTVDSWCKYIEHKEEREKRESELSTIQHQKQIEFEDKVHKRSVIVLGLSIAAVFLLILVAMLKGQIELVKIILTSSLAVAGGAGVTSMFKKGKNI